MFAWIARLVILVAVVGAATPAAAQLTHLGATVAATGHISVIHGVAYAARHDVYLVVYEAPDGVRGRFVRSNGTTAGNPFSVALLGQQGLLYANKPMVAYSHDTDDDIFFVMYASDHGKFGPPEPPPSAWIQRVRFTGDGGVREGAPILAGVGAWELPNDLVYNPASRKFVAVWERFFSEGPDVMVRFFNVDGSPGSGIINVTAANHGQGAAKVAVDWQTNRILVAYQGLHPNSPVNPEVLGLWAKVVDGATGAVLTGLITVHPGFTIEAVPVFVPERNGFVVGWTGFNPGRDVMGRFVSSADGSLGSMPAPTFAIAGSGRQEGAAMGMYDAISRRVLFGVQSSGGCPNDACPFLDGALLDGQGNPLSSFTGLSTPVPNGNGGTFYPDIAVGEDGQFGVSYSLNYSSIWVERVGLPAAPTPGPRFGGGEEPLPEGALTASPSSLKFVASKNGGTLIAATPPYIVAVGFTGAGGGGAWTVTSSVPWLQVASGSGTGPGQFTVTLVNPGDVIGNATSLSGSVVITSPGAPNSPLTVGVSLSMVHVSNTQAPIGFFDTPGANATVAGTIAVSGWALDDIGVSRVEIWRDAIPNDPAPPFFSPGHPGHGKVFIATAMFVEGARPDVEAQHGSYPLSHRAGWGYLMLTWGLPNANGPFTLHAIAWDQEGRSTNLGAKAINVNNAASTKPFGTMDVPSYGGTFSGRQYTYGWVLTPVQGCTMTGGYMVMSIDSAPPPHPVIYGGNRTDIAAIFPGFTNSNGAGGAALLDSTQFTNGLHTIGWLVYDSCGNGDGIGTRFFTIANGTPQATSTSLVARQGPAFPQVGEAATNAPPASGQPLWLVRGAGTPATLLSADATVWLGQTGRIEIHATTPDGWIHPSETFAAYVEQQGVLQPLPIGSSFDTERGIFYWQPVAGFLGRYPLRIVRLWNGEPVESRTVPIMVGPEAGEVLMNIDTPGSEAQVSSGFTLAGWALQPQATDGTGVGAVHAWATKRDSGFAAGGRPVFLGAADVSISRRDVGDHFGRQFDAAGFTLTTAALSPGTYDIVVYASDARTGQWAGARRVTVTVR